MIEEKRDIVIEGLSHSPEQWLAFADALNRVGGSSASVLLYHTLFRVAEKGSWLEKECANRINNAPTLDAHFVEYRGSGATDPWNRNPGIWVHDPNVPYIFDERLNEEKIYDALRRIDYKELKERKYWFVVKRVFEELNWLIDSMDTHFADWINANFKWFWDRNNPWRSVEKEILKSNSWDWNKNSVEGSDIGEKYAEFSNILWNTFTIIPKRKASDKPKDNDYFYLPGKILINNG